MSQRPRFPLAAGLLFSVIACSAAVSATSTEPPGANGPAAEPTQPLTVDEASSRYFGDPANYRWLPYPVTLAPAQWIWLPSERTLPNTFVLFRKKFTLQQKPESARGWMTADSRYRLTVNGQRVQWGPAPCDPRQWDVDPVDLTAFLRSGENVIGVEVLYYGIGEGTWAAGKPGLLVHIVVDEPGGRQSRIVSDDTWRCAVDRAHPPAQPKRWFLRSLQEEFDARQHPYGWDAPDYSAADSWDPPMILACPADKPPSCSPYQTTDSIDLVQVADGALRLRQIPLVSEQKIPAQGLRDSGLVHWKRDPRDWFDFRMPDSFEISRTAGVDETEPGQWRLPGTSDRRGVFATFEFGEQIVGFPGFEIEAPAGTIVEMMTQEAHDPQVTAWMDNHFYTWTRFICREGTNRFSAFDYDSLRWLQLHVHNSPVPVVIRNVAVLRRQFDWPHEPSVRCSEPALQRLFDASVNTLRNSAIETVVDGMGRERQQYSGDGGHQLIAIRNIFGEPRLSSRFLRTFSEGLTKDGYFLDCWPAYDRLARVAQKQMDGAYWGPLLDHGVGFNFDCWHHFMDTGDPTALVEPFPRLVRFAEYLWSIRGANGLLPVEDLGIPTVWIDHDAYRMQRHKQCAFNLYAAAMFCHALAPMADCMKKPDSAAEYRRRGEALLAATIGQFWSRDQEMFVDNLPWLDDEGQPRTSDRALATSVLFDQCPDGCREAAVRELAECPERMGLSYPCNAGWRLWALARAGRIDVVLHDLRTRWATMRSVLENNTLQEGWTVQPDSRAQWSHCAVVPLYVLAQDIVGIRPTSPGYATCQIRPQLGDLSDLDVIVHTPHGPIHLVAAGSSARRQLQLTIPPGIEAELLLPEDVTGEVTLPVQSTDDARGLKCFRLSAGATTELILAK